MIINDQIPSEYDLPELNTLDAKKLHEEFDKSDLDLPDFIKIWRKYFLETMKPTSMPSGWKIDHLTLRTFGKKSVFYEEGKKE